MENKILSLEVKKERIIAQLEEAINQFPEGKYCWVEFDLLKEVFEEIATWDKNYEMGETGMPTKFPWGGEKAQRYFYDVFFRQFKYMMLDFRKRGLKQPSAVGLYEAIDEPPKDLKGKILDKLTPFPEARFGLRKGDGEKKMILRGRRGKTEGPSQLSKIISYLRSPLGSDKENNIGK